MPPAFCLKALWDALLQCAYLSLLTPLDLTQPMEVFTLQPEPPETTLAVPQEEVWAVVLEGYSNTSLHHHSLCFPCPSSPWCTDDFLLKN